MSAESNEDRRQYRRVSCSLQGDFISSDEKYGQAHLSDISIAGAQFKTATVLAKGSHVELNLLTKRMSPLILEGKVCWCRKDTDGWRVGMDFHMPLLTPLEELM